MYSNHAALGPTMSAGPMYMQQPQMQPQMQPYMHPQMQASNPFMQQPYPQPYPQPYAQQYAQQYAPVPSQVVPPQSSGPSAQAQAQQWREQQRRQHQQEMEQQQQQLDAAKTVFDEFERKERDVEVLQALRTAAQERLEKAQAADRGKGPELWIKLMEAHQDSAAKANALPSHASKRFAVKVESHSHTVCSGLRAATDVGRVCWQESLSLPMPEEEQRLADSAKAGHQEMVMIEVLGEDGAALGAESVPLAELREHQKAVLRSCSFRIGWRLSFALQLVYSPARLLHGHVVEFDSKLKQARSELLVCEEKLRALMPAEALRECVD